MFTKRSDIEEAGGLILLRAGVRARWHGWLRYLALGLLTTAATWLLWPLFPVERRGGFESDAFLNWSFGSFNFWICMTVIFCFMFLFAYAIHTFPQQVWVCQYGIMIGSDLPWSHLHGIPIGAIDWDSVHVHDKTRNAYRNMMEYELPATGREFRVAGFSDRVIVLRCFDLVSYSEKAFGQSMLLPGYFYLSVDSIEEFQIALSKAREITPVSKLTPVQQAWKATLARNPVPCVLCAYDYERGRPISAEQRALWVPMRNPEFDGKWRRLRRRWLGW